MEYTITRERMEEYRDYLVREERSGATVAKYLRDAEKLRRFAGGRPVTKELVVGFKEALLSSGRYQTSSVNSFLAAVNQFLKYMGWEEARVKLCRVQRRMFCPDERYLSREEYLKLVRAARASGNVRLALVIQAICATGIRVSELGCITVSGVRKGYAEVRSKGKVRTVLLPGKLQKQLLQYIHANRLGEGPVFRTASGRVLDRSNVWREMKGLCRAAGVGEGKVFPHNLRHLFARCFYQLRKDIVKLADVLGHSSIETTRIYTRSSGREQRRQLERMGLVVL